MIVLLDTNVVSELIRKAPDPDGAPRGCQWANGAATLTSACLPTQPHVGAFPFPVRSSIGG